jgi:hypothetical protein
MKKGVFNENVYVPEINVPQVKKWKIVNGECGIYQSI